MPERIHFESDFRFEEISVDEVVGDCIKIKELGFKGDDFSVGEILEHFAEVECVWLLEFVVDLYVLLFLVVVVKDDAEEEPG